MSMIEPQRPFSPQHTRTGSSPIAEAPTQMWLPPAAPPKQGKSVRWRWLLLVVTLLLLGTADLAAGATATLYYYSDMLLPGTSVSTLDLPLGGLTQTEAIATLEAEWAQQTVTLTNGSAPVQIVPLSELGIVLDAPATIEQAHAQGRTPAALWQSVRRGQLVVAEPIWAFDPQQAEAFLQQLAPSLTIAPADATLHVENGQVLTTPPVAGQQLDVTASLAALQNQSGLLLQTRTLPLVTTAVSPAITDVSTAKAEIEQLLGQVLIVQGYDPIYNETVTWELNNDIWSVWLNVSLDEQGDVEWRLNEAAAEAHLAEQQALLGNGRFVETAVLAQTILSALAQQQSLIPTRIYHAPREHVVQAGETLASIGHDYGIPYPWIQQANPALGNGLSVGQPVVIPSADALLPLPVVQNKRIVVSISEQRVRVYENNALKWDWLASTGIASSPTAPGVFQIQNHFE